MCSGSSSSEETEIAAVVCWVAAHLGTGRRYVPSGRRARGVALHLPFEPARKIPLILGRREDAGEQLDLVEDAVVEAAGRVNERLPSRSRPVFVSEPPDRRIEWSDPLPST